MKRLTLMALIAFVPAVLVFRYFAVALEGTTSVGCPGALGCVSEVWHLDWGIGPGVAAFVVVFGIEWLCLRVLAR